MKALVTGATGFIGGALANSLSESGWQVSVLIRTGSNSRLKNPERFRIVEADLAKPDILSAILYETEADVVIHAAAIRNRWGTAPEVYYNANVAATQALLKTFIGRAQRFVYLSSVGVFGRPGVLGIDENFPLQVSASWDYHSSKAAGEQIINEAASQIETVIVRPTITYGPGDFDGMVTRLFQMIDRKRFFRIGRGDNHVHLTYIDDLLTGLQLAMTHPDASGKTYILAGGTPIKISKLLTFIEKLTGQALPKWHLPMRPARVLGSFCEAVFKLLPSKWSPPITRDKVDNLCANRGFSCAKASQQLGYKPEWSYQQGLQRTYDWLQSSRI